MRMLLKCLAKAATVPRALGASRTKNSDRKWIRQGTFVCVLPTLCTLTVFRCDDQIQRSLCFLTSSCIWISAKYYLKPAAEGYLLPLGDPQRGGGNNDLENLFQCLHPPRMQDTWDILLLVIGVNIEVGFYMKSFLLGISATSVGLTEQLIWEQNIIHSPSQTQSKLARFCCTS